MSKVKVGDKIKLKKEMGLLTDIGTICTIEKINNDGIISFSSTSLPGTLGYMTEDELDKYFEIVKLEELNNNDLNDTIEDLKARLKECEDIVANRKKEQNKVRLGKLEVGDIFSVENYALEYRVVGHLQNYTMVTDTSFDVILSTYAIDSNILVKKVDDQFIGKSTTRNHYFIR